MQSIKKFLEFNGKTIYFLSVSGVFYIALKPICEAINVNYNRQWQNVKSDPILKSKHAKQHIQVPGDQGRYYICLPEKYIYGWLFSINSESQELLEYKEKCYDVLYNFFHGTITRRKEILQQAVLDHDKAAKLRLQLAGNELVTELNECEGRILRAGKELKKLDNEMVRDLQYSLNLQ